MSTIAQMMVYDVFASRPAAGIAGRMFFCTDKAIIQRDNGSTWDTVFGGSNVTTKGDVQGFSTLPLRVAVGTDGDVLTADSGAAAGISWQPGGGGGGTDILGTARFDLVAGAISGARYTGNISGAVRSSSGIYVVTVTGTPTDYLPLVSVQNNSAGNLIITQAVGSATFTVVILNSAASAAADPDSVYIAVVKQ